MEAIHTKQTSRISLGVVVFDSSIYPRDNPDNTLISKYRDAIDHLPPIVIDRKNRIIDGYHRWQAMVAEGIAECDFILFDSDNDRECLMESIRLNSTHGKQLTQKEKKEMAVRLYIQGIADDEIRKIISISERTVRNYLYEVREKNRMAKLQEVIAYRDSGISIREIAEKAHITKSQVETMLSEIGKVAEIGQSMEPTVKQRYLNLWESENEYHERPHHLPDWALESLIYEFTSPDAKVYDSGNSVDLMLTCNKLGRRYMQKGNLEGISFVDFVLLDYDSRQIENNAMLLKKITSNLSVVPIYPDYTIVAFTISADWEPKGEFWDGGLYGRGMLRDMRFDYIHDFDVKIPVNNGDCVTVSAEPILVVFKPNGEVREKLMSKPGRSFLNVYQGIYLFKKRE